MQKPKIFVFSNMKDGGDGICYAIAEDGTILGSHWCSHEAFAEGDLGVRPGSRPDRHEHYAAHYPDGYEMEMVWSKDGDNNEGLQKALKLNQENKLEAKGSHAEINIEFLNEKEEANAKA